MTLFLKTNNYKILCLEEKIDEQFKQTTILQSRQERTTKERKPSQIHNILLAIILC